MSAEKVPSARDQFDAMLAMCERLGIDPSDRGVTLTTNALGGTLTLWREAVTRIGRERMLETLGGDVTDEPSSPLRWGRWARNESRSFHVEAEKWFPASEPCSRCGR